MQNRQQKASYFFDIMPLFMYCHDYNTPLLERCSTQAVIIRAMDSIVEINVIKNN